MRHLLRAFSVLVFLGTFVLPAASQATPSWVASYYNGYNAKLHAMAVDLSGNIYVAGDTRNASGNIDALLIKYGPDGTRQWERFFDGLYDWLCDVQTDAQGNVYVVGVSILPIPPQATSIPSDYITIKYDTNGIEQWSARTSRGDRLVSRSSSLDARLAVDNQGDVYITGRKYTPTDSSGIDILTVKFDHATGEELWNHVHDGLGHGYDDVVDILVDDSDGNVLVGGTSTNALGVMTFLVMKYSRTGGGSGPMWSTTFGPAGTWYAEAEEMHVDDFGVYLTGGYAVSSGFNHDFLTVKLDPANGNILWNKTYDYDRWDGATDVKTDKVGNVFVSGWTWDTTANTWYYTTVKYDPNGTTLLWDSSFYGDPWGGGYMFPKLEVDRSGNVYVMAAWYDPLWTGGWQEQYDIKLVKYDGSDGSFLWEHVHDGGANEWDWAEALALDPWDNVIVAGTVVTDAVEYFYVARTLKYGNSQPGQNVEVSPDTDSTLTFDDVTSPGETYVEYSQSAPPLPAGFELGGPAAGGDPTYIDIETTATFDTQGGKGVHISFHYDPEQFTDEANIKLLHYEGGQWVDITTSVDTEEDIVKGFTTSFSFFAIAQAPIAVEVDIKPGSTPNTINLGSNGVVPVAILSSAIFDARCVDPLTVTLANAAVKLKGKGTPQVSIRDVDNDGRLDLVIHVVTDAMQLSPTDTEAVLLAKTLDGRHWVKGSDSIRIVPEGK